MNMFYHTREAVARNRKAAFTDEFGRRREQFCREYTAYKKSTLAEGEKLLREGIAAHGESISCKKGCGTCCGLYVMASLQEADCIVYHMYRNEAALERFVAAYATWRQKLGSFVSKMPRLEQLIAGNLTGMLSQEEEKAFDFHVHEYAGRRNPCPFLIDESCSIYEVRPFACAALVAVTPPEKCLPDAKGINTAEYRKIEVKMDEEMPYFLKTHKILFGCLPELVNRLLVDGYSFLSTIEGLQEGKNDLARQSRECSEPPQ